MSPEERMRDMDPIWRTLVEQVRPQHTALLVIDMQNDFCSQDGYLAKMRGPEGCCLEAQSSR